MPGEDGAADIAAANEVFEAVNRIRATAAPPDIPKEPVSVRTIRREFGVSPFGDDARRFRKWRKDKAYWPAIEQAALPGAFEWRLVAIWL
ncbi:hypothetical protein C0214_19970 [Methylobacterium sp. DM1]|nr:hypothetical protein C0214_19970 [Methylobacterium sp. DM1]